MKVGVQMNEKIYLGKIVNTHGIKGEIRIYSTFEQKEKAFQKGNKIFIGDSKTPYEINSYRYHKIYDMVTLSGYTNINEVLNLIGQKVWIDRKELKLDKDQYLLEDLIGLEVKENGELLGKVTDIMYNKTNILLKVKLTSGKEFYIPKQEMYIKEVNLKEKTILVENTQGLIL